MNASNIHCDPAADAGGAALLAQDSPRAQQPTDFKGVELKNKAPVSNEILQREIPRGRPRASLKNGMDLMVLEEHRSPTIQVEIAMPASRIERPGGRAASARPPPP